MGAPGGSGTHTSSLPQCWGQLAATSSRQCCGIPALCPAARSDCSPRAGVSTRFRGALSEPGLKMGSPSGKQAHPSGLAPKHSPGSSPAQLHVQIPAAARLLQERDGGFAEHRAVWQPQPAARFVPLSPSGCMPGRLPLPPPQRMRDPRQISPSDGKVGRASGRTGITNHGLHHRFY